MRRAIPLLIVALVLPAVADGQESLGQTVTLQEIVADPQQDWDGDGRVTGSDEYVELANGGADLADLSGWRLLLNDTTPTTLALYGSIGPGERAMFQNPPGELNNNGHVALVRPDGTVADSVRFGSWPGSSAVSADASDVFDEALARTASGWVRRHATPGAENDAPQIRATTLWDQAPVGGWVAPEWAGWANVSVVHADGVLASARLVEQVGENATTLRDAPAEAGGRRVALSARVVAPAANFSLRFEVTTAAGIVAGGSTDWTVDSAAPNLPALPQEVWGNATPIRWLPPPARDDGVGGAEWQWTAPDGTVGDWSASSELSADAEGVWRARVRDALGHASEWSDGIDVRLDATPPADVADLVVEGEGPFRLRWSTAHDHGSGVARIELRRELDGRVDAWAVAPDAVVFDDDVSPGRLELRYGVRAVDGAENPGNWSWVTADHAERHPAVAGVRIRKPVWAGGVQEVRIDFDRAMDTDRPPTLVLDDEPLEPQTGRFLANRTTFYLRWDDVGAWDEGEHRLRVASATAHDGAPMREPAEASFHVDRTAPTMAVGPDFGWTNGATVSATAEDASATRIEWRLWPEGGEVPAPNVSALGRLELPLAVAGNWSFRATPMDAAGNRGTEARGVFRIDRSPPLLGVPVRDAAGWRVPASDVGSGVDWSRPPTLDGWATARDARGGAFRLVPPSTAWSGVASGTVMDVAGNEAELRLVVEPPVLEDVQPSLGEEPLLGNQDLASRLSRLSAEAMPEEPPARRAWPWILGASVGVVGLAAALIARRREAPSFGRRLLAARDRDRLHVQA